jgi:hypothetical protein
LVKVCISDAAANTVIVPVDDEPPELGVVGLLEQPAATTVASAAAITAERRIISS